MPFKASATPARVLAAMAILLTAFITGCRNEVLAADRNELAASVAQRPDIARRLAPIETTPAAMELEDLARQLGIELSGDVEYGEGEDNLVPGVPAPSSYLRAQEGHDRIDPPPAELEAFIARHAAAMDLLVELLTSDKQIQWMGVHTESPEAVRRGARALRGYMRLAQLLSARALLAQRDGKTSNAWRNLEATVNLGKIMGARADILSQIVSIAQILTAVRAARSLEAPVPDWMPALAEHDFVDTALQVYEIEAMRLFEREEYTSAEAMVQRNLSKFVNAQLLAAAEVRELPRCSLDESTYDEARDRHDHIYRDIGFSFGTGVARAASLMITIEGTLLVLRAKEARAADAEGRWPETLALEQQVCTPVGWVYERADDGSMTIRFRGRPGAVEAGMPYPPPLVYYGARADGHGEPPI